MNRRTFLSGCAAGAIGAVVPKVESPTGYQAVIPDSELQLCPAGPTMMVEQGMFGWHIALYDGGHIVTDMVTKGQAMAVGSAEKAIEMAKERCWRAWRHVQPDPAFEEWQRSTGRIVG